MVMKNKIIRSLSLFGLSLMMGFSVAAQEGVKVKTGDEEVKYKSQDAKLKVQEEESKYKSKDLKVKANNEESKLKSDDRKVKVQDQESKYKSADLKVKENENETKIKGTVRPMKRTKREQTEMKIGETQVRTREHITPIETEKVTPSTTPATLEQVDVSKTTATVKKIAPRKYAAKKGTYHKRTAARKSNKAPKTIVRTKVVRDTVFVPSPAERIVSTQTEYVRDTVFVHRVDTVVKTQTTNTYAGYPVPAGDFKKVKLKKDKDGEVQMKRKE